MAAGALSYTDMVKLVKLPAVGGVAGVAGTGKMIGVHLPQGFGLGRKQVGRNRFRWQRVTVGALR